MNFLKRAFHSMKVKKGRTALLTIVFSAILIFILAGLTIQSASLKAIENAKKSMGATVTVSANMQKAMEEMRSSEKEGEKPDPSGFKLTPIDEKTMNKLNALDGIATSNVTSSTSANAKSFEAITSDDTSTDETDTQTEGRGGPGGGMGGMASAGDLSIAGTNTTDTVSSFTSGTSKIVEGVGITEADENTNHAVIEKNLAEANDLKVGDKIKVEDTDEKSHTLEVVGIYESTETADARALQIASLNPYNKIYTSYTFANTLKGSDYKNTADSIVYTLENPEQVDAFVKAAKKAGVDTDTYTLQTNDQVYQQMIEPLKNVESFAQKIVLLVSIAGTIILALIVILTIRERKYEIGVLLSLGESRVKIIAQFFSEMLIVLIMAMVIAGVSGQFVGNMVGQQLLDQQTTTQTATTQDAGQQRGPGGQGGPEQGDANGGPRGGGGFGGFGANSVAEAEQIKELDITLSLQELVELGGFGLAISFLSVILASIGIMRMQPKKILIS
ncbi:ABC transporter permease [Kurthia sp. YJT4]|uniref:ABC transporter permease n=1 Tax=Kurthia sp. YJT4 TaxID=3049086 RepID=UPI00254AEF0F|nr:ABC transporter permease [Kurthia sp. YJT4]WIL39168.1 ABC transporter permease [Kurthia sp. YJT4]